MKNEQYHRAVVFLTTLLLSKVIKKKGGGVRYLINKPSPFPGITLDMNIKLIRANV